MRKLLLLVVVLLVSTAFSNGQTLIINEVSNGPSGNMEYVEFVVIDNAVVYDCTSQTPPCIDIRGWIFDDNSGYHNSVGVATGCVRFADDPLWACVPVGTIIVIYNNGDVNSSIPPSDLSMADGNCTIVAPINSPLFESNSTTPGAIACSYPATGWTSGGNWNNTVLANSGDCARIVDLGGCEVFSLCWGTANANNLIYFSGSGTDDVWSFTGADPYNQSDWTQGCAGDIAACGSNDQTPGAPNNAANAAYIGQFSNNCMPITPIVANAVVNNNAGCNCTGSATATGSGSIPGYTYEWFDAGFNPIGQTTATATSLCAGTYNVIITSSIGCPDTSQVIITSAGGVTVAVNSETICQGGSTTLTATPSTGGGTYSWSPGGQITQSVTVSPAVTSNYTVTYDLGGCIATATSTVTVTPLTIPTFAAVASVCQDDAAPVLPTTSTNGITGTWAPAVSTTTAGTTTYTFTPGAAECGTTTTLSITVDPTYSTSENNTVCTSGSYTYPDGTTSTNITVAESHTSNLTTVAGCDSIVVTNISVTSAYSTSTDIHVCSGDDFTYDDGTIATNITANESYTSSYVSVLGCDSLVTENLIVDPVYNLVEAVNVCENDSYTYPDGFSETITTSTSHTSNLTTVAGCDSIIVTNVTMDAIYNSIENVNACENSTYTYPDGSSETITASTTHTSNLTTVAGCDSIIVTNVTMNPLPLISSGPDQSLCLGDQVTLSASGGVNYVWTGGVSDGIAFSPALGSISYTVTGTDANGCQNTDDVTVLVNPLPVVSAGADIVICEGESIVLNGSGALNYTWTGSVTNGVLFVPTSSGNYTVTGTDANGCQNTDEVNVSVEPLPQVSFSGDVLQGCTPLTVTFTNNTAGSISDCFWNIEGIGSEAGCGPVTVTFNSPGLYDVSLQTTTTSGCTNSVNYTDYIYVEAPPLASFNASQTELTILNNQVYFTNTSINAENYFWDFGDTSYSTSTDPVHTYSSQVANSYLVELVAYSQLGCTDTARMVMPLYEELIFYVPNTFTPDSDQFNQLFQAIFTSGYDPYDFTLHIFNRWGEVIWESHDVMVGWDGTYGGYPVQDGTYTWKIEFKTIKNDERKMYVGHVNVIR